MDLDDLEKNLGKIKVNQSDLIDISFRQSMENLAYILAMTKSIAIIHHKIDPSKTVDEYMQQIDDNAEKNRVRLMAMVAQKLG